MHATAYLKAPDKQETGPMVVLFGSERPLKQAILKSLVRQVLGDDPDGDIGMTRFSGKETDFTTVSDELLTVSMWGNRRLVVVEDADDFVTESRSALEKYLKKPARKSVLVLDANSWKKNTKLAKAIAKEGLELDCSPLVGGELIRWLVDTCRAEFDKQLPRDSALLMVELAGTDLGLLEQELSKLASFVGDRKQIGVEDVRTLVGGWKAEVTWNMTDAVLNGDLPSALACLNKLLYAGEPPQKVLGGINFVFRKCAKAAEIARQGTPVSAAARQAGVFPKDADKVARYLNRIGSSRSGRLYEWLLEAHSNLNGASRLSNQTDMERLLVQLTGPFRTSMNRPVPR